MEMGDHDHHPYGLPDLQLFRARRTHFPATAHDQLPRQPSDQTFLPHRNMAPLLASPPYHEAFINGVATFGLGQDQYDHHHYNFPIAAAGGGPSGATCTVNIAAAASSSGGASLFGVVEVESGGWSLRNMDGGGENSRWQRQETLTLLDIRSKLDSKFKEANHKGPLWDEVSRVMADEHGYWRSGKKCREKFENLYKYYKKTREGKSGRRQDGKNYRFFRQLEALYGGETAQRQKSLIFQTPYTINNRNQENHHHYQSLSNNFFNLSEYETSSSEKNDVAVDQDDDEDFSANMMMMIKEIMELQMKKLIDAQDDWMERMLKTIEEKEKERMFKEEEWRRREMARLDKEHELWVKERAWVKVRDAALMEVLNRFVPS